MARLRKAILTRPALWFGITELGNEALHRLIGYAVELAANPETANECFDLVIAITTEKAIIISDDGRKIPIWCYLINETAEQTIKRIYTPDGLIVNVRAWLNALSQRLDVETIFNRELYTLTCARGEIVESLKNHGPSEKRGTRITFHPDPEVFGDITFNVDRIIDDLHDLATKFRHVKITFEDSLSKRVHIWHPSRTAQIELKTNTPDS